MGRAPRNRTLECTEDEKTRLGKKLLTSVDEPRPDSIFNGDVFDIAPLLPPASFDLLILDPPYNLDKNYNGTQFRRSSDYGSWFRDICELLLPLLKKDASVYVCSDWQTSMIVGPILAHYFKLRNRITWEREKGRGAQRNWKNNTEDIWFATMSDEYTFNVDAVKLKKRVIAPYRSKSGRPKDWKQEEGGRFRLTYPSNIWTDITIPFWSMPENTDHPTQKPEKLMAKLILASSNRGELVLDPFLGSGTTAVAARKLDRRFIGIEREQDYAIWAAKRLEIAERHREIQGYAGGVFWERNAKIRTGG